MKLRGSLGSSAEVWEAPATVGKLQGQRTSRESITKATRRRDNCRETGRAVGKLASLSRTEGTSTQDLHPGIVERLRRRVIVVDWSVWCEKEEEEE